MASIEQENIDPNVAKYNPQHLDEIPQYFKCAKKRRSTDPISKSGTSSDAKRICDHDTVPTTLSQEQLQCERIAAATYWIRRSVKHRRKFERLLEVWQKKPQSIEIVNDNAVCFQQEFLIGAGSCGTAVYICLGCDGVERAIKVLPRHLCQRLLNNERDILNSSKAIKSPQIVNYSHSGDAISSLGTGYLILNLYEQNLEEYVKDKGDAITKSRAKIMTKQILKGLRSLHGTNPKILHRDLKPSNILVDVEGNLALSDFGIGRILSEEGTYKRHQIVHAKPEFGISTGGDGTSWKYFSRCNLEHVPLALILKRMCMSFQAYVQNILGW